MIFQTPHGSPSHSSLNHFAPRPVAATKGTGFLTESTWRGGAATEHDPNLDTEGTRTNPRTQGPILCITPLMILVTLRGNSPRQFSRKKAQKLSVRPRKISARL